MKQEMVRYYRTAERVDRYSPGDSTRKRGFAALYRRERPYFGRRVLDLACGGGILGFLLEDRGHTYVGVDINPDMLREARSAARRLHARARFLEGDIATLPIPGRFDTLTLLGNALSHLRADEAARLLATRRQNVHRGAYMILHYRDTVAVYYKGLWKSPYVETHKGARTVHRTQSIDWDTGVIQVRAKRRAAWSVDFTVKIWSPFITAALLADHGWVSVHRRAVPAHYSWVDVYRFGEE